MSSRPRSVLAQRGRLSSRLSRPMVWDSLSNMAFGIERAFTSCSRRAEGGTFQSSKPFPRSRTFSGSMGGGGCCFFVSLGDLRITSPLPVRLQPVLDYFRESIGSEISAVDDSKPAVVELFPRDDL